MSLKSIERNVSVQYGIAMEWHKKTILKDCITTVDDVPRAVLPMESAPLYTRTEAGEFIPASFASDDASEELITPVITRMHDGDRLVHIGKPMGKDYQLITNRELLEMALEAISGTKAVIYSVGCFSDWQRFAVCIKVSDEIKAAGRVSQPYLNLVNGHGGIALLQERTSVTAPICENTFQVMLRERGDICNTLKKTKNARAKLPDFAKMVESHIGVAAEFALAMDALANVKTNETEAREFFAGFISRKAPKIEALSTRAANTVDRLMELFRTGAGNDGDGLDDTFNAITDYYSHESSGGDNRARQWESSEFGSGATNKREAFGVLTKLEMRGGHTVRGAYRDTVKRGGVLLAAA